MTKEELKEAVREVVQEEIAKLTMEHVFMKNRETDEKQQREEKIDKLLERIRWNTLTTEEKMSEWLKEREPWKK